MTRFGIKYGSITQTGSYDKPLRFDSEEEAEKYMKNFADREEYTIFSFDDEPIQPTVKFINNKGDISYEAGGGAQAIFTLADGNKLTVKVDPHRPNSISVTTSSGPIVIKPDVGNQVHIEVGER